MTFNDPDPRKHDIVLIVENQKFYCSKKTLAKHEYFCSMFFSNFEETNKSEVELHDPTSAEEFQTFLEILHGVPCLKEENVHGVLRLASTWLVETVKYHCIKFLLADDSEMTRQQKFDIAAEFLIPELVSKLLESITIEELEDLLDDEFHKTPQPILGIVFKKMVELKQARDAPAVPEVRNISPRPRQHPVAAPEFVAPRRPRQYEARRRIQDRQNNRNRPRYFEGAARFVGDGHQWIQDRDEYLEAVAARVPAREP